MLNTGKSMTARIKSILWLWLGVAVITSSVVCQEDGDYLTIPAHGKHAKLGFLYDARKNRFLGVDVFKGPVAGPSITTTDIHSTDLEAKIIESNADKFDLFKIKGELKLEIALGAVNIDVKGSGGYLHEEITSGRVVTGMMFCNFFTVAENLHLYYDELKDKYNTDLLKQKGATHILNEIKWGGGVTVEFSQTFSDKEGKKIIKAELQFKLDIKKIHIGGGGSFDSIKNTSSNYSNFAISVKGDMLLPNLTPTTIEEVHELLRQAPSLTRQANNGKGRPIQFVLTPISHLRRHLQQTGLENEFAKRLDEAILNNFIAIFETISKTEQKLNDLLEDFDDNSICIDPSEHSNLTELRDSFLAAKIKFQSEMSHLLISVRSNSSRQEEMTEIAKNYSDSEFSPGHIKKKLHDFDATVTKIELYKTIRKDYPNVTYFGHLSNLDASLLGNLKNVVYILFMFPANNESNITSQQDNYNLFFVKLNKPLNTLFVVDCYFKFLQCNSLNKTVIQQMVSGRVNMKDVNEELKLQQFSSLLKMKALGRFAKMGQLYDIRTNTFLQDNFFKSEIPQSLIQIAKSDRVETNRISSETLKGKFKALNVEPGLQYSILADLFEWSRSGKYFAKEEEFDSSFSSDESKCLDRSFLHIRSLREETISFKNEDMLRYFAADALSKGATHCVITIEYGFLSIFQAHTMVHDHRDSKINNKYWNWKQIERKCADMDQSLKSFATTLSEIVNRIEIPKANSSYNYPNILTPEELKTLYGSGQFSVDVYSDIQGPETPPERISSADALQFFLSKTFIRKQRTKNDGKGVPIAYVLYPLANLSRDAGIISPYIPYHQLSSHSFDSFKLADIFDEISVAKIQIDEMVMVVAENTDCVSDHDLTLMKTIHKDFDSTLGEYQNQFMNHIRNIKSGKEQVEKMKELLKEYKSMRVFDNTRRYVKLEYMNNATEKMSVCNELKKKGITYFGRQSAGNSFNDVFEKLGPSLFYVFYYHYSWKKTHIESWRENVAFLLNLVKNKYQNLFVVNCEFKDESCKNVTRPVIHEYARGGITSYDYLATVREQNGTIVPEETALSLNKRIGELQDLIHSHHSCKNQEAYIFLTNTTIDFQDLGCGGLVQIPLVGHTVFLKYKLNGNSGEEQRCLWTLHGGRIRELSEKELRIFLLCDNLGSSSDLLTFYEWSPNIQSDISYFNLRSNTGNVLPTQLKSRSYLYFNTKHASPGTEFIVQVDVLSSDTGSTSTGQNWFFDTVPGRLDHLKRQSRLLRQQYSDQATSIAVVAPKTQRIQFTVELLDFGPYPPGSDNRKNEMDVYELGEIGIPKLRARVLREANFPLEISTEYPVIAVYMARFTDRKAGTIQVSWK